MSVFVFDFWEPKMGNVLEVLVMNMNVAVWYSFFEYYNIGLLFDKLAQAASSVEYL